MIRFRLGKSKRLAAFFCALLLALETVAFPLTQAKAAATAALTAVGFGVTTAAFLAACGIYPYWADDSSAVNFDWEEWVDDDLTVLVNEYNAANSTTPINPNQISAFLSGATLLVGNYAWEKLCDFAEWIKTKYAVTDNQTGIELGETTFSFPSVPYVDSTEATSAYVKQHGIYLGVDNHGYSAYYMASVHDSAVFYVPSVSGGEYYQAMTVSHTRFYTYVASVTFERLSSNFDSAHALYKSTQASSIAISRLNPDIPYYSSISAGLDAYLNNNGTFSGITADTSTVFVPAALPEGTEYGGLRVSGLPAATMAETVIDAVQDSVGERLKTPVEVVGVELAPGTEIDSGTGTITQNPVVIEAPVEETIPAVSELIAPDSFVGTAVNALQTKFPFCLPFDVMRIAQAFIVPPSAPVITLTFHEPFTDADYTISVDLSPWDDVAAVVRFLWSLVLFVGFSLRISSLFRIDRSTGELFLGNVGSPGV